MANTGAPTLEELALKSSGPASAGAAGTTPPDGDQIVSAFRFGWSLEELVWRLNSWQAPTSAGPEDDFPPDLTHERSSAEHVRELATLLTSDGNKIDAPNPPQESSATTLAKVRDLLTAYESNSATAQLLTGAQRIGATIRLWDADIVDAIIDQDPTILTAYELGKALSLTQWRIRGVATPPARADGDPVADAWQTEFSGDRITTIRRHLDTLAPAVDGRNISAVSASLSFWSRAYEKGSLAEAPSSVSSEGQPRTIPTDPVQRAALIDALDKQLANWYDLLTDRRELDSFPVTAVVSDLVGNYASSRLPRWQGTLLRIVGIVVAILVLAIVVAVLLAALNASAGGERCGWWHHRVHRAFGRSWSGPSGSGSQRG